MSFRKGCFSSSLLTRLSEIQTSLHGSAINSAGLVNLVLFNAMLRMSSWHNNIISYHEEGTDLEYASAISWVFFPGPQGEAVEECLRID